MQLFLFKIQKYIICENLLQCASYIFAM